MTDIEASIAELRAVWGQGPGIHKRPNDLARYDILFERVKPNVLVETGLYYGGSAIHFAERVPHIINVELPDSSRDPDNQTTADYKANRHGLGFPPENGIIIEGHSFEVVDQVEALVKKFGGPVMVVLNSNHDTETVYGEMVRYNHLVTLGSYMVVEDGLLHYLPIAPMGLGNWFDGDPLIAIERFLSENDEFEVDTEIEDMFPTTQFVKGWLRKQRKRGEVQLGL